MRNEKEKVIVKLSIQSGVVEFSEQLPLERKHMIVRHLLKYVLAPVPTFTGHKMRKDQLNFYSQGSIKNPWAAKHPISKLVYC